MAFEVKEKLAGECSLEKCLFSLDHHMMFWSIYEVWHEIFNKTVGEEKFISTMLRSVGAIIIAVAIVDVAKHMIEEELLEHREKRSPKDVRETLTKILIIVTIAVGIEGLIYIFKAGARDITLLIYPAILITTAVIIIVGLGVYQKLSVAAEKMERQRRHGELIGVPCGCRRSRRRRCLS